MSVEQEERVPFELQAVFGDSASPKSNLAWGCFPLINLYRLPPRAQPRHKPLITEVKHGETHLITCLEQNSNGARQKSHTRCSWRPAAGFGWVPAVPASAAWWSRSLDGQFSSLGLRRSGTAPSPGESGNGYSAGGHVASSPHSWGRSSQTCSLRNYNQRSFLVHKKGTMGIGGWGYSFWKKILS